MLRISGMTVVSKFIAGKEIDCYKSSLQISCNRKTLKAFIPASESGSPQYNYQIKSLHGRTAPNLTSYTQKRARLYSTAAPRRSPPMRR